MDTGPAQLIDLRHLGRERVIGSWLVDDVIVDPGPTSCIDALLEGLGGRVPRALALTHIHLDHAGAAGSLCARWPSLEVWVHERGARHMADPSKLMASATRLYGDQMERLWGEMVPVPEDNLRVLTGGETMEGGFDVAYTPGHASHHVAYLHHAVAYVGDLGGVRIPPEGFVQIATPPPDIDLEAWSRSLAVVRAWAPARLALTHFGVWDDVGFHLDQIERALEEWSERARVLDVEAFREELGAAVASASSPETLAVHTQAAPFDACWAGLQRYFSKQPQ